MKRSLLALAVLGTFAGAASAQSSVTIYGIVDLDVQKSNDGLSNNPGAPGRAAAGVPLTNRSAWTMQQGANSRLGFRGVEDLGGGLSAFFDIQHRFNADTGGLSEPTTFWQAKSVVGLKGGFGTITLGRDYIVAFWPALAGDPWGWDTVGQMGRRYTFAAYAARDNRATGDTAGTSRNSNQIAYTTPSFGGFTATGAVALGEGSSPTFGRAIGFNAEYKGGPLYVGLGYDRIDNLTAGGTDPSLIVLTGAYDLGVVRPTLLFAQSKSPTDVKTKSFVLGLTAPIGNGVLKAAAGFLRPDVDNTDGKKFSVGYFYNLSKRTAVYADVGSAKDDNLSRTTSFDLGIKHAF